MTNEEKTSLKAACLQAATTLIAARDAVKGVVDVDQGVKLAAELDEPCRSAVDGGRGSWLHLLAARRAAASGRSRHTPELLVGRQSGVSYRVGRTAASRSLLSNSGGR